MPGILPMKVIKVGNSLQSRVAQACDRCRSKKIRCDGIRPCCSQCANVGFECKTSDKLSRRAFPRGYTESLEERVRSLEAEVRELKSLLDEKDEKLEMISQLHSISPTSRKVPLRSTNPSVVDNADDAFENKLERSGRQPLKISMDAPIQTLSVQSWPPQDSRQRIPPLVLSEQLLNVFFQEWAPLYPVVHRPTILSIYSEYTKHPQTVENDKFAVAQLNLIFGIAAASSRDRFPQDPIHFERNWISTLESLSDDISLSTLQCYVLAQIYYSLKADYKSLLRYRSLAVAICLQLGLHQSQERFAFNTLLGELRKRVFWCQYSLDRFSAALTGLPVSIAESDICTEYPADIDDENVNEAGFVPAPSQGSTRISSALALFSASRILNKALEQLYPSPTGYEISLPVIHSLAEELDDWLKELPPHLRLEFIQDKPSTGVTSSRSPVLSIVYYFIRGLIRRPAVCYGKPEIVPPSMLTLVDSAKHIIQLLKLLEERRMSVSVCISKRELIFLSSLGLLWQNMDLPPDSKLAREGQRLLNVAMTLLESESAEVATELGKFVNSLSPDEAQRQLTGENLQFTNETPSSPIKGVSRDTLLQPMRTRFSFSSESDNSTCSNNNGRPNFMVPSPELSRSVRSSSSHSDSSELADRFKPHRSETSTTDLGMDYLHLDGDRKQSPSTFNRETGLSDWEHVLSDMDNGHANIYNGIYGGSECGETPAAFAALASSYQRPGQIPQHHTPPVVPSLPPQNGWTSTGWPSTNNQGHMPSKHGEVSSTQAPMSDAYEAIMISNLDAIDENGADFAIPDSWIGQCVM
ncbi:FacB protein [Uncinocarpus reesii 1704]|uniref:FacB protein n=1 Tax=Uncinocarpus reesii (strain UAMH 1704) TaxID=336963 RepID=C4JPS2_UNCRE|nr:FacB protein [Uncinocarpus reesii 1704]EEP79719.1 FacB protein [Uncinocarpus reesii 1704]